MSHEGNWYVLVFGLPVDATSLRLASGIAIRQLDFPLTVFDLAAAGAVGFSQWAVLEPLAAGCTCEIETARDADQLPGYDTLHRAWLVSALLALRGHRRHMCVAASRYSWNRIASHSKRRTKPFQDKLAAEGPESAVHGRYADLPEFKGGLLDYHVRMLGDPSSAVLPLTREDADWIDSHFETCNQMAAQHEGFRLALEAAHDWRFAPDQRSAVARLWAGIEALFGVTSELVFRISLLSAAVIEPRGQTRLDRFNSVKKLYGLRSKAVHGDRLKPEALNTAVQDSFDLLRLLLLKSIEAGRPFEQGDFDRAVFF